MKKDKRNDKIKTNVNDVINTKTEKLPALKNTQFYKIFFQLNQENKEIFQKFLLSPFSSLGKKSSVLCSEIVSLLTGGNLKEVEIEQKFKELISKNKITYENARKYNSLLYEQLKRFLLHLKIAKQNDLTNDLLLAIDALLDWTEQTDLTGVAVPDKTIKNGKQPISQVDLQIAYLAEYMRYRHNMKENPRHKEAMVMRIQLMRSLDIYYIVQKLTLLLSWWSAKYTYNVSDQEGKDVKEHTDFIFSMIEMQENLKANKYISLFYYCIKLFKEEGSTYQDYYKVHIEPIIKSEINKFLGEAELNIIIRGLLNYFTYIGNFDAMGFWPDPERLKQFRHAEAELYELAMNYKVLELPGKIDVTSFKNIIAAFCRAGRTEIAEKLIVECKACNFTDQWKQVINFCEGLINFTRGAYRKAFDLFGIVNKTLSDTNDFRSILQIRKMRLKCCIALFHLEDDDVIDDTPSSKKKTLLSYIEREMASYKEFINHTHKTDFEKNEKVLNCHNEFINLTEWVYYNANTRDNWNKDLMEKVKEKAATLFLVDKEWFMELAE